MKAAQNVQRRRSARHDRGGGGRIPRPQRPRHRRQACSSSPPKQMLTPPLKERGGGRQSGVARWRRLPFAAVRGAGIRPGRRIARSVPFTCSWPTPFWTHFVSRRAPGKSTGRFDAGPVPLERPPVRGGEDQHPHDGLRGGAVPSTVLPGRQNGLIPRPRDQRSKVRSPRHAHAPRTVIGRALDGATPRFRQHSGLRTPQAGVTRSRHDPSR